MRRGRPQGHRREQDLWHLGARISERLLCSPRKQAIHPERLCTQRLCTQPHFGCMLGAKCACINFPRKGDLFMTIMPFLAQGETVAPRQPVMHHGFPKMHHDFGQCTKLSPEMHHENEKCTKLFLKCTKANGKMQPGFLILSK